MDANEQQAALAQLIALALAEDLGPGDATTAALALAGVPGRAEIRAKQAGTVSGLEVARQVFQTVDCGIRWEAASRDGETIAPGCIAARAWGSAASLLTGERTALNFLQHLSGVATRTAAFVERVAGRGVAILDTRKTSPGQRWLEKEAVRHGGGCNHRQGLYDALMIKENHAAAAGGLAAAIGRARSRAPEGLALIVEVRDARELELALQEGVTQILLDNFTPEAVGRAAERIAAYNEERREPGTPRGGGARGPITVEVSGGITLANVADFARPGVDYISVGGLTHSAPALDFSLGLAAPFGAAD